MMYFASYYKNDINLLLIALQDGTFCTESKKVSLSSWAFLVEVELQDSNDGRITAYLNTDI